MSLGVLLQCVESTMRLVLRFTSGPVFEKFGQTNDIVKSHFHLTSVEFVSAARILLVLTKASHRSEFASRVQRCNKPAQFQQRYVA
jgi:hypothetical protein